MSAGTSIEWTSASYNPIRGTKGRHICQRISPGCKNCYAATMNRRFRGPDYVAGADEPRLDEKALTLPLRWRKPQRIFVCSMTDLFWERIPDAWIDHVFAVMALAPRHTFQVLTKRAGRARDYLGTDRRGHRVRGRAWEMLGRSAWRLTKYDHRDVALRPWPLPNVHLGVSVEDQAMADERIPLLLQTPAAVRFVSYEPALGPIHLNRWLLDEHGRRAIGARPGIGWVIVGGESGPGARPFDLAWARSTVAQCRAAGVPVFVKQLGARPVASIPDEGEYHVGMLRDRKGGTMEEWPTDLRVREFPEVNNGKAGPMSERVFPPHIGTSRRWKARKRRELAALERALRVFHVGCAYTPIRQIGAIAAAVREWRRVCSVKEWGR